MSLVLYIYNICPVSENLFFFQKLTASPSHSKKTASLTECGFSVLSRMANFCRSLLRDQNL